MCFSVIMFAFDLHYLYAPIGQRVWQAVQSVGQVRRVGLAHRASQPGGLGLEIVDVAIC